MIESLLVLTLLLLIFMAVNSRNQTRNTKAILIIIKELTDSTIPESTDKLGLEIVAMGKDDSEEDVDDIAARIVDSNAIWEEDALTAEEVEKL